MDLMEAISRLDHSHIIRLHLSLVNLLFTELAKSLLSFLLDLLVVGLSSKSLARLHKVLHIHLFDFFLRFCLVRWLESSSCLTFLVHVRRGVNHFDVSHLFFLLCHDWWRV